MEQINTIDKISAVYRNTAEEARQELNKVQQKIYRIGSLRLLLFVAGVVGIIYFWSEAGVYWPALPSSPYCRSYF